MGDLQESYLTSVNVTFLAWVLESKGKLQVSVSSSVSQGPHHLPRRPILRLRKQAVMCW